MVFHVCISHMTHDITHHCLWDKKYFEGGGMSSKAVSCRKFLLNNRHVEELKQLKTVGGLSGDQHQKHLRMLK